MIEILQARKLLEKNDFMRKYFFISKNSNFERNLKNFPNLGAQAKTHERTNICSTMTMLMIMRENARRRRNILSKCKTQNYDYYENSN